MNTYKQALEEIKNAAEQHPCFMGYVEDGITKEEIDAEGGDIAFVTLDIAWIAKTALDANKIENKTDYKVLFENLSILTIAKEHRLESIIYEQQQCIARLEQQNTLLAGVFSREDELKSRILDLQAEIIAVKEAS